MGSGNWNVERQTGREMAAALLQPGGFSGRRCVDGDGGDKRRS